MYRPCPNRSRPTFLPKSPVRSRAASSALTGRVAALETTVGEVVVQVKDQENRLKGAFQELFDQQTQRIEALLAKRQRQE